MRQKKDSRRRTGHGTGRLRAGARRCRGQQAEPEPAATVFVRGGLTARPSASGQSTRTAGPGMALAWPWHGRRPRLRGAAQRLGFSDRVDVAAVLGAQRRRPAWLPLSNRCLAAPVCQAVLTASPSFSFCRAPPRRPRPAPCVASAGPGSRPARRPRSTACGLHAGRAKERAASGDGLGRWLRKANQGLAGPCGHPERRDGLTQRAARGHSVPAVRAGRSRRPARHRRRR